MNQSVFSCDAISPNPQSPTADRDNLSASIAQEDNNADAELMYDRAAEFLSLTEKLKSAPELLQEKYATLHILREEINKSLDRLQEQSQSMDSHVMER